MLRTLHLCLIGALSGIGYASAETNINAQEFSAANIDNGSNRKSDSLEIIEAGRNLYASRCGACHSIDANRIGPMHRGVYGRKAGSAPGYAYSDALSHSDLIWDEQTLDQWLADPQATIPGQKMGFRLSSRQERASIIAYLKTLSETE